MDYLLEEQSEFLKDELKLAGDLIDGLTSELNLEQYEDGYRTQLELLVRSKIDAGAVIQEGLNQYVDEVTKRSFPQEENWFGMPDDEYKELLRLIGE